MAKPAQMTAFLGRCRRLGLWQVPPKSAVFALFGTCHLDMRLAYTAKDTETVKMKVTSIFGGVEIIVPDGVEVRPSGAAFLAVSDFDVPKIRQDASLPPIELDSLTVFGRLRLHTAIDPAEAAARDAEMARVARESMEEDDRKARQEIAAAAHREAVQAHPDSAAEPASAPAVAVPVAPAATVPAASVPAPAADTTQTVEELTAADKKAKVIAAIAAKKAAKAAAEEAAEAGPGEEPSEEEAAAIAAEKKAKVMAAMAAKKAAKKAAEEEAAAAAAAEADGSDDAAAEEPAAEAATEEPAEDDAAAIAAAKKAKVVAAIAAKKAAKLAAEEQAAAAAEGDVDADGEAHQRRTEDGADSDAETAEADLEDASA